MVNITTLLSGAGTLVAAALVAVKPLAKAYVAKAITAEGDVIRAEIDAAIKADGPKAANAVVDGLELRLKDCVDDLHFIPTAISAKMKNAITSEVFVLEQRIDAQIAAGGVVAFDFEYTKAQAALLAKVEAL